MMERENNIPGPTWQSVWINLIIRATEEWRNGLYISSWKTTLQLYAWLPKECKEDVKDKIEKIRNTVLDIQYNATVPYSSLRIVERERNLQRYLAGPLLDVHAAIEQSLETRGWISKAAGVSPQVKHTKPARF